MPNEGLDTLTSPISKANYIINDHKACKWLKVFNFVWIKIIPIIVVLPLLIIINFIYFTTDNADVFKLPVPGHWWVYTYSMHDVFHLNFIFVQFNDDWRYPFDWKNPFGYLIATALEYLGILVASFTMASVVHFHIGADIMLFSLTKDVNHELMRMNEKARAAEDRRELINELIPFHSNATELSKNIRVHGLHITFI